MIAPDEAAELAAMQEEGRALIVRTLGHVVRGLGHLEETADTLGAQTLILAALQLIAREGARHVDGDARPEGTVH